MSKTCSRIFSGSFALWRVMKYGGHHPQYYQELFQGIYIILLCYFPPHSDMTMHCSGNLSSLFLCPSHFPPPFITCLSTSDDSWKQRVISVSLSHRKSTKLAIHISSCSSWRSNIHLTLVKILKKKEINHYKQ